MHFDIWARCKGWLGCRGGTYYVQYVEQGICILENIMCMVVAMRVWRS